MIETKEQYEVWRREYEMGIDSGAERDAFETIEALRETVRAIQTGIDDIRDALQSAEYSEAITITIALDLCQEAQARVALPDWITKNGR